MRKTDWLRTANATEPALKPTQSLRWFYKAPLCNDHHISAVHRLNYKVATVRSRFIGPVKLRGEIPVRVSTDDRDLGITRLRRLCQTAKLMSFLAKSYHLMPKGEIDLSANTGRFLFLVTAFQQQAKDPAALKEVLRHSGLTHASDNMEESVEPELEAEFVRYACDFLGDVTFGARSGLNIGETATVISYIGKSSATLRKAIENSQRYYRAIDPSHSYSLRISGNSASFELQRLSPTFARYHRYTEFLLFAALRRMRTILGVEFFPIEARFDHPLKTDARAVQKMAGFPVCFGAERTEILLPLSALDLPVPTYDPKLRTHLMEYGERLLRESPSPIPTVRSKVEAVLLTSLPGRIAPADEVASSLGMSRRTFARRLSEEGLSFRKIVDDLRCDLAKTYLKEGLSLSEVAFILDYADQAAFSTAFKRWVGVSPSGFRGNEL